MIDESTIDRCLARLTESVASSRDALARDTLRTIQTVFKVGVTERPEHRSDGLCAVDGSYFHNPPRMVIASAESPRRRAFTALHELGHHLVRHNWQLFELARDRSLEEKVCDRFAAEILLPMALSSRILSSPIPKAREFARLYDQSHASRAVCARRVASALPGVDHAVVALGTTTTYCASARTPFRAEYGIEQGDDSIFGAAMHHGAANGPTRLFYGEGVVSPPFLGDAVFKEEHVFAIFVELSE